MIRQLREKQNREVGEYNNAINRQVINKMHSQVALWESDRPSNQILDTETITNYEETVQYLNNLLTNKLTTIETVDLNNSGSEKQYKEIIDNTDFINKYNLVVKPLSAGNVIKKTKSAIENLIQPLQPLIEQITLAFNKLVNNARAVGLSRINPVLSSYSVFDYIKQQFKNNSFVPIVAGNLQSYYSNNFIPKLGPSIVDRLKVALDEYNRQPNLRKEAMASQVGRLSPEELKGILKLQGISEFPLSASIGVKPESEAKVDVATPLIDEEQTPELSAPPPATPEQTEEVQQQPIIDEAQQEEGKRLIKYWRQFRTKKLLTDNEAVLKRELGELEKITGQNRNKPLIRKRNEELTALRTVLKEYNRGLQASRAPAVPVQKKQTKAELLSQMPAVPKKEMVAEGKNKSKNRRRVIVC